MSRQIVQPERILIVLLGSIGDVTRALPLAVRLKRAWPNTRLTWAIEPKSRDIVTGHPSVDEVLVFERDKGWAAFRAFLAEVRARRFDLVLDLQRHFKSGLTSRWSGARRRIGFHPRNAKEGNWIFNNQYIKSERETFPKIAHYQRFGDLLELPPLEPLDFELAPRGDEAERVEELLAEACAAVSLRVPPPEKRIALLIGGSWPSKQWPAKRFGVLAIMLAERLGCVSFLIGSAADERIAHDVWLAAKETSVVSLAGKTSLRDTVVALSGMRAAVGPDSGPMHIAAAVGVPVVSIWGPTNPGRNAPLGSEELGLKSPIGCSPCYRRVCPGLENLCMSDIPSEAVFKRVRSILEER